jgi:predicted nucleotidyltransferase
VKLSKQIIKRISDLLQQRNEVIFAYVFGSRLNKKTRYGSDLDIAVYFNDTPDLLTAGELVIKLEEATEQKIDLVKLNDLDKTNSSLAYSVLDTGVLICNNNENILREFKRCVILNFLDFDYARKLFDKAFKKRLLTNTYAVFDK